ncbi:hypothetical protein QCA50_008156 [Cerrena zonata]|uniref:Uncharacterized protein n=1 Tax=Cerrena zonata TaxID=2478898 RepID=A0AAW0G5P6_9APHY
MSDQRHVPNLQYFPPDAWSQGSSNTCNGSTGTTTSTTIVSTTSGSYATFMFQGHLLTISGVKAPNSGQLRITVNDLSFRVDLNSGSDGETCSVLFNQTFPEDLYRVQMTLLAENTSSPEVGFTDISYFDTDGTLPFNTDAGSPKSPISKPVLIALIVGGTLLSFIILIPIIICIIRRYRISRSHPDSDSQVPLTPSDPPHVEIIPLPLPSLEPPQPTLTLPQTQQIVLPTMGEEDEEGMCERRTSTVLSYGRTNHLVSTASASALRQIQNGGSHSDQPPSSYRAVQTRSSHEHNWSESSTRPLIREWTRPVPSSCKPPLRKETRPILSLWRPIPREETRPIPRAIGTVTHPTGGISSNEPVVPAHIPEPSNQADFPALLTLSHSAYPSPNENEDSTSLHVQSPLLRVGTTASMLSVASSSRSSSRRMRTSNGTESTLPAYSPGIQLPSYLQAVRPKSGDAQ